MILSDGTVEMEEEMELENLLRKMLLVIKNKNHLIFPYFQVLICLNPN